MQWACQRFHHVKPRQILRLQLTPGLVPVSQLALLSRWSWSLSRDSHYQPHSEIHDEIKVPRLEISASIKSIQRYKKRQSSAEAIARHSGFISEEDDFGDYRQSYELVEKLLLPLQVNDANAGASTSLPRLLPVLNQQAIYQFLQHVKEGVLPEEFSTLQWLGAERFWVKLLEKCLGNDALMEDIFSFARWWSWRHGVHWPKFYETTIYYYLGRSRFREASSWHDRLTRAHLLPDRSGFAHILSNFAVMPDQDMQRTLRRFYSKIPYKNLYDLVIPRLYRRGYGRLSIEWHSLFCRFRDYPHRRRCRPFLIYLQAFFPATFVITLPSNIRPSFRPDRGKQLDEDSHGEQWYDESQYLYDVIPEASRRRYNLEHELSHPDDTMTFRFHSTAPTLNKGKYHRKDDAVEDHKLYSGPPSSFLYGKRKMTPEEHAHKPSWIDESDSVYDTPPELVRIASKFHSHETDRPQGALELSHESLERTLDPSFTGISDIRFDDKLGARWFASTWMSLDMALNFIDKLGIDHIGPLSLRSIARRENSWQAIRTRLAQLSSLGIRIDLCNYTILLTKLVHLEEQEYLTELLNLELPPDSFEKISFIKNMINNAETIGKMAEIGLWQRALTILVENFSNCHLVELHFENRHKILEVLDDIATADLELQDDTLHAMVHNIMGQIPKGKSQIGEFPTDSFFFFHAAVCTRLLRMGVPIPISLWKRLFESLGEYHKMDILEDLAQLVAHEMLSAHQRGPGFFLVNKHEMPRVVRLADETDSQRYRIPNDHPATNEWHPLARIFDPHMQSKIIRWSIRTSLFQPYGKTDSIFKSNGKPRDFYVARGIRLLRILKDKGLFTIPEVAIVKRIVMRLAELYGPASRTNREIEASRKNNVLTLDEFVSLCDQAWGEKLLPPRDKLMPLIELYSNKQAQSHLKYKTNKAVMHIDVRHGRGSFGTKRLRLSSPAFKQAKTAKIPSFVDFDEMKEL